MRRAVCACAICFTLLIAYPVAARHALSLADCIQAAYQYNPTLKSQEANVDEARGAVETARAGFLPSVTGKAELTGYARAPGFNIPNPGAPHPQNHQVNERLFPETRIALDQTIYDFGRTLNSYRAAQAGEQAQDSTYQVGQQDLSLHVAQVFFGVLLAEKQLEIASAALRSLNEYYRTVSNMYAEGAVQKNDLLVADVSRSQAGLQVSNAKQKLEESRVRFANVIGVAPEDLDRRAFVHRPINGGLAGFVKEAKENRLELVVNDRRQDQALAESKAAKSQYFPDLYAHAEASYKHDDLLIHKDQYSFTVGMRWPFFDGLAARGKQKSARARLNSLSHQRDAMSDTIALQVTTAFNDLKFAEQTITVERKNKTQAAENLRIQRQMYENGASTSYDVMKAESMWIDAQSSYYDALYRFNVNKALLLRATGSPIAAAFDSGVR